MKDLLDLLDAWICALAPPETAFPEVSASLETAASVSILQTFQRLKRSQIPEGRREAEPAKAEKNQSILYASILKVRV